MIGGFRRAGGLGGDECAARDGRERWCGVEERGGLSVVPWRRLIMIF